ncbi:HlyD family secretion protein [Sinanaerobacter chloroacetimidivorans]|jgi:HlyD family secretion protein|uniref:HlyD family efflux transporter periplasmic adaptor subunit n=1 Tax=Sinanaerobacter chloroacetimidivorans TaxID=2818044 RepID=A0A8J7W252_9FIRM|nr:HlyD family efflux transporter periplasmic adaptor subunit [Sinanaerobacter chloroacetimidivorans]MBR0597721.1 HlyD family efflux transporter periplasmic adaptor subunit [Sinanaerobacter chloroacetimidivorans]
MNHAANHKKKIIPLLILIVAAALIFWFYGKSDQNYIGVVEATILSHTSEVSGKILEMPIELGFHVSKGDVIARIDSTTQQYAYEQLQFTLEKKKLALADLEVSGRDNQAKNSIAIAQSTYNSAASSNQKASLDYQNAQSLYDQGAISRDDLDKAKVAADSAANALTAAKAQLDNARSQSSAESMHLDIAQTESQLKEMKENLDKYTIRAVSDGVVMSKSYVLGDMVASGYNLADIASDNEKYFVFYLPIDDLYSIDYDQTYTVKGNGKSYTAVVKYIDVESEYTPKDMQTIANKNRESVKIKLLLPEDCPLKPGQEAKIEL